MALVGTKLYRKQVNREHSAYLLSRSVSKYAFGEVKHMSCVKLHMHTLQGQDAEFNDVTSGSTST